MVLVEDGDEALVCVGHECQVGIIILRLLVAEEPQEVGGGFYVSTVIAAHSVALEDHPHHHLLQFLHQLRVIVCVLAKAEESKVKNKKY